MRERASSKWKKTFLYLPVSVSIISFFLFRTPTLRKFELITYDWRMAHGAEQVPSGNVVIVFIGDETLRLLGKWPLRRQWYSALNDVLHDFGARTIAYDILFLESSENSADDAEFAASISRAGNVVLPFFFVLSPKEKDFPEAEQIFLPLPVLQRVAKGTGFLNTPSDIDGITRRYLLFLEYQGVRYPALGVKVLQEFYGLPDSAVRVKEDGYVEFDIKGKTVNMPADRKCSALVNIYRDLNKIPHYSFIQVLQSYMQVQKGQVPAVSPAAFKDKIVLVGLTTSGTTDSRPVPGVPLYYMVGLQASFLENFFHQEFIKEASAGVNLSLSLLLALGLTSLVWAVSPLFGLLITFMLAGLFLLVALWLFNGYYLWVDLVPVIASLVFTYFLVAFAQFLLERKEKLRLKSVFQKYVSPAVMDQLLAYPKEIPLGGEKRYVTVLFADIHGFTPLAEKNPPEKTVELLNKILNVLVEAVFKNQGTLDKFIGDAVMAIYGAPVEETEHAKKAVFSAIEMVRNVRSIQESEKDKLDIGIGINTGFMVIGNIGSERRMEYTAIGDTVNLAARIQTQSSRGDILLGEETYGIIKEEIPCELLGTFQLKGKAEPVRIYRVKMDA